MKIKDRIYVPLILVSVFLIISAIILYTGAVRNTFIKYAKYSVYNNNFENKVEIDSIFDNAVNSIQLVSQTTSKRMTGRELENPNEILTPLLESTPFSFIEYIRYDGMNFANSTAQDKSAVFDASNREYYINGMKGITGIWINLHPKYSSGVLINFYTPLYYDGEIAGVLTGTLGENIVIKELLESDFFNHKMLGFLCDKDFNVLASSGDKVFPGLCLAEYSDNSVVSTLINRAKEGNSQAFEYKEPGKNKGIASITPLKSEDMYSVLFIESDALYAETANLYIKTYIFMAFVLLILIVCIIVLLSKLYRESRAKNNSHLNLINALSSTYENIYVANINTGALYVYRMSDEINEKYAESFSVKKSYEQAFELYAKNEVYEDDKKLFYSISTIEKVRNIFENNNEYSFIYRVLRDEEIHYFQCCLFRPSGKSEEFVAAFKDVDKLIWQTNEENELASIQEVLNSGKWNIDFDNEGKVRAYDWSDAFCRILGFNDAADFSDSLESLSAIIHPEDKEKVISAFYEVLDDDTGKLILDIICRLKTKNNGWRYYRVAGRVIRREDGSPIHIIGVLMDVDEHTRQYNNLISLTGIYITMHTVNLENNTVAEIATQSYIKGIVQKKDNASEQMRNVMHKIVDPNFLAAMLEFSDLDTIAERIKNKVVLSSEFMGVHDNWIRASFIVIDSDNEGIPKNVFFVTQDITEEKQREEMLINKANTDELTHFYNRHAYENDTRKYLFGSSKNDFIYVSMDVNGLKLINDNYGHNAGDELIYGAAECIKAVFGKYGRAYRTGGDEFCAVLDLPDEKLKEVEEEFHAKCKSWSGDYVKEISISCGFVKKAEAVEMSFDDVVKLADKRMYEDKSVHYASKGIDRTGQQSAFDALCQLYIKTLKVNLTDDSYSIIQMDPSEHDTVKGFDEKLSVWFRKMGEKEQIAEKDLELYYERANLDYLKKYFSEGNKVFSIYYDRIVNGKFHKVSLEMMPTKEYTEENQILYLYVRKI